MNQTHNPEDGPKYRKSKGFESRFTQDANGEWQPQPPKTLLVTVCEAIDPLTKSPLLLGVFGRHI